MASEPKDGGYKEEKEAITVKSKKVILMWTQNKDPELLLPRSQKFLDPTLLFSRPGCQLVLVSLIHYTLIF